MLTNICSEPRCLSTFRLRKVGFAAVNLKFHRKNTFTEQWRTAYYFTGTCILFWWSQCLAFSEVEVLFYDKIFYERNPPSLNKTKQSKTKQQQQKSRGDNHRRGGYVISRSVNYKLWNWNGHLFLEPVHSFLPHPNPHSLSDVWGWKERRTILYITRNVTDIFSPRIKSSWKFFQVKVIYSQLSSSLLWHR